MRISNLLTAMAAWLESPDNEALLLSEYNSDCMVVVATSCIEAANALKKAAAEVEILEPKEASAITYESVQGLSDLATTLDSSLNPDLMKQASLIDELLITISAPQGAVADKKAEADEKIEELRKKYQGVNDQLAEQNKTADLAKEIEDSGVTKNYKPLEAPLNTRYCPDHPGVQISRVDENVWQCELDKKKYDFAAGFELMDGSVVPGGEVSSQTDFYFNDVDEFSLFDTREGRLNTNKP